MSELDAIRRTNNEHDFYQTLPCQIKCLSEYLFLEGNTVIDAGSGKQIIAKELERKFPSLKVRTSEKNFMNPTADVIEFDFDTLKPGLGTFPVADYGDFLDVWDKFDVTISNPPYSLKDEFIKHALEISNNVFMLFPLQVINYIEFCEQWLDIPEYCGRITMYPKVILNSQGDYIQGGNTGYAWFHWKSDKDYSETNPDASRKYEVFEDIRKYI